MTNQNVNERDLQKNNFLKDVSEKNDEAVYQAIIRHVGGVSNLREIIENVTGQKIDLY